VKDKVIVAIGELFPAGELFAVALRFALYVLLSRMVLKMLKIPITTDNVMGMTIFFFAAYLVDFLASTAWEWYECHQENCHSQADDNPAS